MSYQCCNISFDNLVLNYVSFIPAGYVTTYGRIAIAIGYEGYQRQVGSVLSKNPYRGVPCYRVVMADGKIGSYFGDGTFEGKTRKAQLLANDGVPIKCNNNDYQVDMDTASIWA